MARLMICVAAGCEETALPDLPHCDKHEAARKEKLKARRAKAQTSAAAILARALYNDPKWVNASKAFLRNNPLCADCAELGVVEPATDVDHIEAHKGDRKQFWNRTNWQALCHRCHSRKTAREVFHQKGGYPENLTGIRQTGGDTFAFATVELGKKTHFERGMTMRGKKPNLENVVPMKGDIQREIPPAPDFLDDIGRQVWDELVPELVKKDRMDPLYKYQFGAYCASVSKFISATNELALEGLYYSTGKGRNGNQMRRHPAVSVQEAAMADMRRDSALFGLSPVDAARLGDGGQGDLFDEVMNQLNGTS